jgi:plastocyanin
MKKILNGAVIFLALTTIAHAGTVLISPDRFADPDEGEFPSSQFGVAPPHAMTSGFAANQVVDMEEGDDGSGVQHFHASRGIASVGDQPNSGIDPSVKPSGNNNQESKMIISQSSEMKTATEMSRKGVQEVAIIASDLGYFPKTVFVSRDVPVRMFVTGSSKNTLCIMMDSFQVRKQIRSQKIEEITFTPSAPGKYRFYCPVNGMEGSLVVKEFSNTLGNEADAYDQGQGQNQMRPRNPASSQRSSVGIATQWDSAVGGPQR